MSSSIRVRFAPSPTGPLHIGGLRTALFNYLFAKKHNGKFILRIEDTDQNRFVEGAENYIIQSLEWIGLTIDEGPTKGGAFGPYRQSERKNIYKKYAEQLIKEGKAYYAFDTPEELDGHRKDHEEKGKTFIYNWHNREKLTNSISLTKEEVDNKLTTGTPYVIRFKSPEKQELTLQDEIRGEIKIDTSTLDDKVLFKNDGLPTYHLANIVDDHLMEITHVIRGEEWLPSLALHHLLYDAFGWKKPSFSHLPLILKPTGKGKLSKRDGEKGGFPVFPLSWKDSKGYKESGYFPESVVNFLAFLGWNPGTEQEMFSLQELTQAFKLDRVNKSGARFDPDKTKWYNQQWLQRKPNAELTSEFFELLKENKSLTKIPSLAYTESVVNLIKERAVFVSDFWELSDYFFKAPEEFSEKARKKHWKENTASLMQLALAILNSTEPFSSKVIEENIKNWITKDELSFGKVMPPLRLAIVGDLKGPHLFDIIEMIGKEESLKRLQIAIECL
ncbi:glutamate--tRNA ligase [Croceivirga lutea]|uniref:glutamate--tRNA ligase n=1 Tax=Croceivirga lutea TaxID=1775167 RepID=UPI0016398678|nr:glutamate--tRNA ligase [Croceivirga lutea]GGG38818.1 glutamate--tRNA ligase [Croceivirga lutea]